MRYMRVSHCDCTRDALTPQWQEYNVEVFNVGQLRRSKARTAQQEWVTVYVIC